MVDIDDKLESCLKLTIPYQLYASKLFTCMEKSEHLRSLTILSIYILSTLIQSILNLSIY